MPVAVAAEPDTIEVEFARTALLIIDMQRDFLEPGGFGETLGNDVSLLAAAVPPCRPCWRQRVARVSWSSTRAKGTGRI